MTSTAGSLIWVYPASLATGRLLVGAADPLLPNGDDLIQRAPGIQ